MSPQPLKLICKYFNGKLAVYFAFLGYYTYWLALASVLGFGVYLYDFTEVSDMSAAKAISEHKEPVGAKNALTPADDNRATMAFALFMSLWGTLFLENWKRHQSELAHRWGLNPRYNEAKEDVVRHEFQKNCGDEKHHGFYTRDGVASTFVCVVMVTLIGFLVMRLVFQRLIDVTNGAILASTCQAAVTVGLNYLYQRVAVCMVEYENYRTELEFQNAITYNVFGVHFINTYFTLFYVAFVKGRIGPLFGYSDVCKDSAGQPTGFNKYFQAS